MAGFAHDEGGGQWLLDMIAMQKLNDMWWNELEPEYGLPWPSQPAGKSGRREFDFDERALQSVASRFGPMWARREGDIPSPVSNERALSNESTRFNPRYAASPGVAALAQQAMQRYLYKRPPKSREYVPGED